MSPRREHCPHNKAGSALPTETELGPPPPQWLSAGLAGRLAPSQQLW